VGTRRVTAKRAESGYACGTGHIAGGGEAGDRRGIRAEGYRRSREARIACGYRGGD
jgi:hypothetical protein